MDFHGIDQFSPGAVEKYEHALEKATKEGRRIRGILLCHPHNPLGQCYPRETLIAFMQLCNKHKLHLIVDEIYALSVYNVPDPKAVAFESILSLETDKYINSDYLHLLYGMSKDNAASGIRLGCIHTLNAQLMRAMSETSMYHWSGNANEKVAIMMLEDEKWMDWFLQLSRDRLSARNLLVRKILDEEGISYHRGANAGFMIWIDLRPFLSVAGDAPIEERWAAERQLAKKFAENKVYITSGAEMSAEEPGWFRVIFSQDEVVIKEGLRRYCHRSSSGAL